MHDTDLRDQILDALEFEPSIDAADIGVAVEDGIITLTGHVPSYSQKITAERIVSRVKGVRGIAQEIEVRPVGTHLTADDEIAKRAVEVLRWNTSVPHDAIQVKVSRGRVTLTGEVDWRYERDAAERAVQHLKGVTGVYNQIDVRAKTTPADVHDRIARALRRDAELEAAAIKVEVMDGIVRLNGDVHSYHERREAEKAAWAAPGVRSVEDRLRVV